MQLSFMGFLWVHDAVFYFSAGWLTIWQGKLAHVGFLAVAVGGRLPVGWILGSLAQGKLPQVDCQLFASWFGGGEVKSRSLFGAGFADGARQSGAHIFDGFFPSFYAIFDGRIDDVQSLKLQLILNFENNIFDRFPGGIINRSNFLSFPNFELLKLFLNSKVFFLMIIFLGIRLDHGYAFDGLVFFLEGFQFWEELEGLSGILVVVEETMESFHFLIFRY